MEKGIRYEITKTIAILCQNDDGSTLELNLIRWFGRPEKFDLRRWARTPSGERIMLKGIKLSYVEVAMLRKTLDDLEGDI